MRYNCLLCLVNEETCQNLFAAFCSLGIKLMFAWTDVGRELGECSEAHVGEDLNLKTIIKCILGCKCV